MQSHRDQTTNTQPAALPPAPAMASPPVFGKTLLTEKEKPRDSKAGPTAGPPVGQPQPPSAGWELSAAPPEVPAKHGSRGGFESQLAFSEPEPEAPPPPYDEAYEEMLVQHGLVPLPQFAVLYQPGLQLHWQLPGHVQPHLLSSGGLHAQCAMVGDDMPSSTTLALPSVPAPLAGQMTPPSPAVLLLPAPPEVLQQPAPFESAAEKSQPQNLQHVAMRQPGHADLAHVSQICPAQPPTAETQHENCFGQFLAQPTGQHGPGQFLAQPTRQNGPGTENGQQKDGQQVAIWQPGHVNLAHEGQVGQTQLLLSETRFEGQFGQLEARLHIPAESAPEYAQ